MKLTSRHSASLVDEPYLTKIAESLHVLTDETAPGVYEGLLDGDPVGPDDGVSVGSCVGSSEGLLDGDPVGPDDGVSVGSSVGSSEGLLGDDVFWVFGSAFGDADGDINFVNGVVVEGRELEGNDSVSEGDVGLEVDGASDGFSPGYSAGSADGTSYSSSVYSKPLPSRSSLTLDVADDVLSLEVHVVN